MSKKFIIAGGGTGGHIFPAVAIANALKKELPDAEFLFVGAKGKMEMEKIPQAGFKIDGLDIAGFNRSAFLKNFTLPWKLIKSFLQVKKIILGFKPDAVIGVGGYSSFPVLRYAQRRKIPTFIHESNSFAGKANIMLGKRATKIFVATKGMQVFFPADKIIVSGNPVRDAIANHPINQSEALQFFGLESGKTTVLAVGGSLGAASINEALKHHLHLFEINHLQLIWQTGKTNAAQYKQAAANQPNIWVSDFITQMEYGYAAADIVISRAGAMAVTELCITGKPAILVPFPFAAEDHQTANAMQLVNQQAAIMVKDSEAAVALVNKVIALAADKILQNSLSQNIRKVGLRDADTFIAHQILKYII
ncbi:MAG: undecaprenyldiphospho-muramoylpentapeptide beta-N-acetylglucosaminyltransferase [Sphingobacteriia bacterium]|nr:MAG: undecaprenyldiphospho-muramoylpentapeptide beta-N-acetylglucosaminyltransferase [Sphingobacteriia bacterium]TAG31624.1 MAG: undecaprenyldiphospho-muramoylpentapeptide beta-N-acetylglucosaminyltransferase [Sphingobacteriia bacterium]